MPVTAPDATFVTRHVSFAMSAPYIGGNFKNANNTVESFLASAHPDAVPPVRDLAFSGLYNSVVGAVVDRNTPVVNSTAGSTGTYGTYMRLEATIQLTNGQYIYLRMTTESVCGLMASRYRDLVMGAPTPQASRYKGILLPD